MQYDQPLLTQFRPSKLTGAAGRAMPLSNKRLSGTPMSTNIAYFDVLNNHKIKISSM
jgi:hypothetical protein